MLIKAKKFKVALAMVKVEVTPYQSYAIMLLNEKLKNTKLEDFTLMDATKIVAEASKFEDDNNLDVTTLLMKYPDDKVLGEKIRALVHERTK